METGTQNAITVLLPGGEMQRGSWEGGSERGRWWARGQGSSASIILVWQGERTDREERWRGCPSLEGAFGDAASGVCCRCGLTACRAVGGAVEAEGSMQPAGKATLEDTAQRDGLCCPTLTFFSEYWNISMASSTCPSS